MQSKQDPSIPLSSTVLPIIDYEYFFIASKCFCCSYWSYSFYFSFSCFSSLFSLISFFRAPQSNYCQSSANYLIPCKVYKWWFISPFSILFNLDSSPSDRTLPTMLLIKKHYKSESYVPIIPKSLNASLIFLIFVSSEIYSTSLSSIYDYF